MKYKKCTNERICKYKDIRQKLEKELKESNVEIGRQTNNIFHLVVECECYDESYPAFI